MLAMHRPIAWIVAARLLLVVVSAASASDVCSTHRPPAKVAEIPVKTFITNGNIEILDLGSGGFAQGESFYDSWNQYFPASSSPLYDYNAKTDPERALTAVHDAYAFAAKWLPPMVLARLAAFPFRKHGSSAILIRGLPIDTNIPLTPTKANVFEESSGEKSALVPVAESWLLGITRILGIPMAAPYSNGGRGGLVRDITQNPDDAGDLPMHRDYPALAINPDAQKEVGEPEILILFGVRGDAGDGGAQTVVMDSAKLLKAISSKDIEMLRTKTIMVEWLLPDGKYVPVSKPFRAIQDDETGRTVVTLHNLPRARYLSPDGGTAAVEAYERVSQLAFDLGERVELRPGDMLIMQNSRLVHGRTRFNAAETCCNGSGRWLVKSYVSNRLWRAPGAPFGGFTDYPHFSAMDWKSAPGA